MGVTIHDPKNERPLSSVWVFVSRDKDGNEGILSVGSSAGDQMPLITGNPKLVEPMRKIAASTLRYATKTIHLLKFEARTELEEVKS